MKKLIVIAIAIFGFTAVSFGQTNTSTVGAGATGTIITPITIGLNHGLNFGTIVAAAGTVTVIPGNAVASYSGPSAYTGGTVVAPTTASFTVNGNYLNTFTISVSNLPATVVHSTDVSATMAVATWTSNATSLTFTAPTGAGTGLLNASGTQTFEIGATLTVAALQKAGTYNAAAPFNVKVDYN